MRKTLIATAALLAAVGAAQADPAVGDTTNNAVYQAGPTTFPNGHFHGPNGAPGVGFAGSGGYIISLQSIDPYTGNGSVPSSGHTFYKYQLPGYTHSGPGGTINATFNWARVPGATSQASASDPVIDRRVYFGLITDTSGTVTPTHAAFYTGDPTDRVVPTATTNYAAVAFLATPTTSASAPVVLTGNLQYNTTSGTLNSANASTGVDAALQQVSGTSTLQINTTVSGAAFTGYSSYNGGVTAGSSVSGQFFGSGAGSAVAGMASGSGYVASFGGIKN